MALVSLIGSSAVPDPLMFPFSETCIKPSLSRMISGFEGAATISMFRTGASVIRASIELKVEGSADLPKGIEISAPVK